MSVVRDRLLDFWEKVYLQVLHDLVAAGGEQQVMAARVLGDLCASAANEAEMRLLKAMRMHCPACLGTKRIYGVGEPPEGKPCETCFGSGNLLWTQEVARRPDSP